MLESVFLLLTLINMVVVIIICIKGCTGEMNENTIKSLIISAGVCIFLTSVMWRFNLWNKAVIQNKGDWN